jgi:hypothetical protein
MAEAAAKDDTSIKDDDAGAGDQDDKSGDKDDKGGDNDDGVKDDQLSGAGSGQLDVEEILDEYGLDSADDLKEFIANLSAMQGKIGEHDLDALIENTKTLQKYQANWQQQDEEKRRETETPEQTIARLEKENKNLQTKNVSNANRQKAAKAAETALSDFGDTVETVISSAKALPKEYAPFVAEFMGVDNPINEVDITDKAAVRRLTKAGINKINKFEQAVIKRYRAGKIKIPKVTSTEPTPGSTGSKDAANPKNLKEAKSLLMQSLAGISNK